jgi:FkbM family methyltransferase
LLIQALLVLTVLSCRQPTAPTADPKVSYDPSARYLVGAHYYSWFSEAFDRGFLRGRLLPPQQPELGLYSAWDVAVAEQQISWASEFGIDFFTLDYWPTKSKNDGRHETFLQASNIGDVSFCIFYETIDLGFDAKTDAIFFDQEKSARFVSDLEAIADRYFAHPSYLRIDGRPVVILYVTRTFTGAYQATIQEARRRLKAKGHDVFLIGDEVYWSSKPANQGQPGGDSGVSHVPQVGRIEQFDAITAYNFYNRDQAGHLGYGSTSRFIEDVIKLSQEFAEASQVPLLPSVIPGYNDRGFRPQEDHAAIPRQWTPGSAETGFMSEMLDRYALPFVDQSVPILFVTSWNEWNEDTGIEPLRPAPPTAADQSGRHAFTQGYSYAGHGTAYLAVLRDKVVAVSGRLTSAQERPLSGKTISAWRGEQVVATDVTDSQGRFHLSRLTMSPGSYLVGLTRGEAVPVRVNSRQTASGLVLASGEAAPQVPAKPPDLSPRRRDLDLGLEKYIEAFPKADYQVVTSGGYRYYLDAIDNDAIKDILRARQPWEPHVQEQLRQLLRPGDVVLDVGAHVGTHTTLMADLVGKDGVVYAFEPQKKIFRELVHNLRLNGITNAVPLRFALGDRQGVVEMNPSVAGNEGGTGVGRGGDTVELRTLDSFHFDRVDLVKIDVEGYEDFVLGGATETMSKHKPLLLLEIMGGSDYATATPEIRRRIEHTRGLLSALGYRAKQTWHHDYLAIPIERKPDSAWLDLGRSEHRDLLLEGFSSDELDGKTSFVWSQGSHSALALPLATPASTPYTLGLRVRGFEPICPVAVSVSLNGVSLGSLSIGPEWGGHELSVPANLLKGGENVVRFTYEKNAKPSDLQKSGDQRSLAMSIDLVWLAPAEVSVDPRP